MSLRQAAWRFLVAMLFRDDRPAALLPPSLLQSVAFWEEALSIANANLVTAPLWTAIRRAGIADEILSDARDYLEGFHAINSERNGAMLEQLAQCCALLANADIDTIAFKGSGFLVDRLYETSGDRFLTDLDVIVPRSRALAAWNLLRESGYAPSRDSSNAFQAPHKLEPLVRIGAPAELEVHVAPVPDVLSAQLPVDELWAHAQVRATAIGSVRIPNATDALVNCILHTELIDRYSSRLQLPLRAYFDLYLLWKSRREGIDEARLAAMMSRGRARSRLHRMVASLRALTREACFPSIAPGVTARINCRLCRMASEHRAVADIARRVDSLSDAELRDRFGISDPSASMMKFRLRALAEMLHRRVNRGSGENA